MVGPPISTRSLLAVLARRGVVLVFSLGLGLGGLSLAVTGGSIPGGLGRAGGLIVDGATLNFGAATGITTEWVTRSGYQLRVQSNTVSGLIGARLVSWAWLLGWTLILTIVLAVPFGVVTATGQHRDELPSHTALGHIIRLLPVFLISDLAVVLLAYSERLFNFDWDGLLLSSPPVLTGLQTMPDLSTVSGIGIATKWVIVPAALASTAIIPTAIRAVRAARTRVNTSFVAWTARNRGVDQLGSRRVVVLWLLEGLPAMVVVLQIAALVAESAAGSIVGMSRLLTAAYLSGDVEVLAGIFLLLAIPVILADIVRVVVCYWLTGRHRRTIPRLTELSFPAWKPTVERFLSAVPDGEQLRNIVSPDTYLGRLRVKAPAILMWLIIGLGLGALQLGAVLDTLASVTGLSIPHVPTLISWETIPDAAYREPDGQWVGGFLGLSPAVTWALRLLLAVCYLLAVLVWLWAGGRIHSVLGSEPETPLIGGPVLKALKSEWRIPVGAGVVCLIVAAGLFAPATAPSMADDPTKPYHQQYVSVQSGDTVDRTLRLGTVLATQPDSSAEGTPGPMEYDRFDRFHPFGVVWDLGARQLDGDVPVSRDLFEWWVRSIQDLLSHVTVLAVTTLGGALILVGLGTHRRFDRLLAVGADILALGPILLGTLVVREFIVRGDSQSQPGLAGGNGPIGNPPDPLALTIVGLGLVGAILVARAVRRQAAQAESITARLRYATGPAAGYAALAVSGSLVYVVIARVFARLKTASSSPGPTLPALDPRAALNHTWIDTALWYTSTVPLAATLSLLIGIAILGDGIRRISQDGGDPEGDGAIEPQAGGGGA